MSFGEMGMCDCVLTIKLLVKVSEAKNCVENPLWIPVGDWDALPAFLHNVEPENTQHLSTFTSAFCL